MSDRMELANPDENQQGIYKKMFSLLNLNTLSNSKTTFCKHKDSCAINVLKSFSQNFGLGFSIKAALGLLLGLAKSKAPIEILKGIFSLDTLQFASFIGFLPTLYKLALCLLRHFRQKDDGYNSLLAAIFSSISAF
mmetsp:Transcript_3925/g.3285  ORF Transcript_3925/g.3285 Transcript_3925/m.3285 type:complete len:136 (+) Transcript_3925:49-456(+)